MTTIPRRPKGPETVAAQWWSTGRLLLVLLVGSALILLAAWQFGHSRTLVMLSAFLTGVTLVCMVAMRYRTRAGGVAATAVLLLVFAFAFVTAAAVGDAVLERHGTRTLAEVTKYQPAHGKRSSACLLRAEDGRDIPDELSPCDGRRVGDAFRVVYDPAGRQSPIEGTPEAELPTRWAVGLFTGLVLLLVSLPLWAHRGRRVELRKK
ncbi:MULTISPECIES: hypothetical protein [Kitasatospora]|uniref:DUF3592 domain-containing protein n=1 Tax=Kitasatospora setae (strain ATCC 33774 / DSM 43861 / JCM 3304 / KCC A-0304 / NBRC 14216 / KM-6054) TaxID=452652 RepID=E4N074_KITSK|nr:MULTISPECIES: hypothetical protein [Kitasatospora]BAJ31402.1 hypothetical protein KSE_56290 [Kitasatospora setae KM-6054]